jgi:hypothetical protein
VKILEKKIEEANDDAVEQNEQERVAVKSRAKKRQLKDEESADSEVDEAINKGKAKAIDNVFKDVDTTEKDSEDT